MMRAIETKRLLLLALLTLPLSACQHELMTAEQKAAVDDQACRSYGAVPGSDAYVICRGQQEQIRQQEIAQSRAMAGMASTVYQQSQAQRYPPPSPTINCTSRRQGIYVNTSCY